VAGFPWWLGFLGGWVSLVAGFPWWLGFLGGWGLEG
jgi:hypothetical protein